MLWCSCQHTRRGHDYREIDGIVHLVCLLMICNCTDFALGEVNKSGERNLGLSRTT
jgi:hypothetical protein